MRMIFDIHKEISKYNSCVWKTSWNLTNEI